jgi:hypothetical protein
VLGLDRKSMVALSVTGQPIPQPLLVRGLVDTASDITAVAAPFLQRLALSSTTSGTTQTAGGVVPVDLYEVSLSITNPSQAGSSWFTAPQMLVMELTTLLRDTDVLIGLDIRLQGKLFLDGPARRFTLDF